MSRASDYNFVSLDTTSIRDSMIAMYEELTGEALVPGSPESLFVSWVLMIIQQERAMLNYAANQNLPSRAEGENLDALAELFYLKKRPDAMPATTTIRFSVSEAPEADNYILIPEGTRATDASQTLFWATTDDVYVPAGATYVDIPCVCQTAGEVGNGYAPGQINQIVDVYMYYSECSNVTESANGSDAPDDDRFYDLLQNSLGAYSTAGSKDSYIYHAKAASDDLLDVVVNSPEPGKVHMYVIGKAEPHTVITQELYDHVFAACNDDKVRPLTDQFELSVPGAVAYTVEFTYYMDKNTSRPAAEISAEIQRIVADYKFWQESKIGRDINPSKLIGDLMACEGVKRINLRYPTFYALKDGSDGTAPEAAKCNATNITNGGYEDD